MMDSILKNIIGTIQGTQYLIIDYVFKIVKICKILTALRWVKFRPL